MYNFGASGIKNTPPVVKNLILLNVILLLIDFVVKSTFGVNLTQVLGLYYVESEYFNPFQYITHMFMHGGLTHLFFNMFALWMFGRILEGVWGSKRFFIYYFVTGLGAAALHSFVHWIEFSSLKAQMSPEQIQTVYQEGARAFEQGKNFVNPLLGKMNIILNTPTVGASGAVFGVLLGFGMLFPNTRLMLLFPPIPIKAKYLVIGYGVLEIYLAFSQPGSNIAHFAHIGGMLFGFILIKYWNKDKKTFY